MAATAIEARNTNNQTEFMSAIDKKEGNQTAFMSAIDKEGNVVVLHQDAIRSLCEVSSTEVLDILAQTSKANYEEARPFLERKKMAFECLGDFGEEFLAQEGNMTPIRLLAQKISNAVSLSPEQFNSLNGYVTDTYIPNLESLNSDLESENLGLESVNLGLEPTISKANNFINLALAVQKTKANAFITIFECFDDALKLALLERMSFSQEDFSQFKQENPVALWASFQADFEGKTDDDVELQEILSRVNVLNCSGDVFMHASQLDPSFEDNRDAEIYSPEEIAAAEKERLMSNPYELHAVIEEKMRKNPFPTTQIDPNLFTSFHGNITILPEVFSIFKGQVFDLDLSNRGIRFVGNSLKGLTFNTLDLSGNDIMDLDLNNLKFEVKKLILSRNTKNCQESTVFRLESFTTT